MKRTGCVLTNPLRQLGMPFSAQASNSKTSKNVVGSISVTLIMPDDTQIVFSASRKDTLLEAVRKTDVSDVWDGGACGGACNCTTCCLVPVGSSLKALEESSPMQEDEEDILDSAKGQADQKGEDSEFLASARLSCQIALSEITTDNLELRVPQTTFNLMEIPLWLRNR